mmetsp:Transcript_26762/g.44784  ORF Transcript_26762/g.44784 Transcript_26762/m.44784 type:complete len:132 (+) Transcript_26762:442-837(+)
MIQVALYVWEIPGALVEVEVEVIGRRGEGGQIAEAAPAFQGSQGSQMEVQTEEKGHLEHLAVAYQIRQDEVVAAEDQLGQVISFLELAVQEAARFPLASSMLEVCSAPLGRDLQGHETFRCLLRCVLKSRG